MLHDGSQLAGRYLARTKIPLGTYRKRYAQWHASAPEAAALPQLGVPVRIKVTRTWLEGKGVLAAFTQDGALLDGDATVWRYAEIESLTVEGGSSVPGKTLLDARLTGRLPLITALKMETVEGLQTIPFDEIALVRGPSERHAARTGFMIGLVFDAMLVVIVATQGPPDDYPDCSSAQSAAVQIDQVRKRALAKAFMTMEREFALAGARIEGSGAMGGTLTR